MGVAKPPILKGVLFSVAAWSAAAGVLISGSHLHSRGADVLRKLAPDASFLHAQLAFVAAAGMAAMLALVLGRLVGGAGRFAVHGVAGGVCGYCYSKFFMPNLAFDRALAEIGVMDVIAFALGAFMLLLGVAAFLGSALAHQPQFQGQAPSRQERRAIRPAAGSWIVESSLLLSLALVHAKIVSASEVWLALMAGLVLAYIAFTIMAWRSMDELMRRTQLESIALGAVVTLVVAFCAAALHLAGRAPGMNAFHAITIFYLIYLPLSIAMTALRIPGIFAQASATAQDA